MQGEAVRKRVPEWIAQLRGTASAQPATGACAVATALQLWAWTFDRVRGDGHDDAATAADGGMGREGVPLRGQGAGARQVALVEALGLLLSARALVLEVAGSPDGLATELCHAHVGRACGEAARLCAEVVFGWLRHPSWDEDASTCYHAEDLDALEEYVPGLASCARAYSDVLESDGSHPAKAGPCVKVEGIGEFVELRTRLDGCLAGAARARERAGRLLMK